MKKAFPRLPVVLPADSMYASEPVMDMEFVNDIDYNGRAVNMLRFWEEKIVGGESIRTKFQWLTDIGITRNNVEKTAGAGR